MTSKTKLNLYCQKSRIDVPCYTTERIQDGFISTVTISGGQHRSKMAHSTKKMAEDNAASAALEAILLNHPNCSNIDELIDSADQHWGKKRNASNPYSPLPKAQQFPAPITSPRQVPIMSRGPGDSPSTNDTPCSHAPPPKELPTKSNDQALLEVHCQRLQLGEPEYHVCRKQSNLYSSTVTIGGEVYSTEQEYGDFEKAKESATTLAVAALGIRNMKIYGIFMQCLTLSAHTITGPHKGWVIVFHMSSV